MKTDEQRIAELQRLIETKDNELRRVRRELGNTVEELESRDRLLSRMTAVKPQDLIVPAWLSGDRTAHSSLATPVLVLSDLHLDEVVQREEMDGMNEYNRQIAEKRLHRTIDESCDYLRRHVAGVDFDGIVVPLLGDILTGSIHEELAETNESPVPASIVHWVPQLVAGLRHLADEFGTVFVPTIDGNHDRTTKRTRFKRRAEESYAWIIYNWMADTLRDDDRITFSICTSPEQIIDVHGTRFLLTHGDGAKGGQGIGGIWPPIMRWVSKKQSVYASQGRSFDYALMGHWHQLTYGTQFIINGSLKGYDEYARGNGFQFERPQQALFLVTPRNGITMRTSIFAE